MTKKQIAFVIFFILFFIHLIIGLNFFDYLGDGGDLAGGLLRIGDQIKLLVVAFILPLFITLFYTLLTKDVTKFKAVPVIALVIVSLFSIYFYSNGVCHYIVSSGKPHYMGQNEYIEYETEKVKEYKKRVDKQLKTVVLYTPPDSIQKADKLELEKIVRKEWDCFYSPLMRKRPDCEPLLNRINQLISAQYSSIETDSVIELRKRTTQTSYILYSPSFKTFIAILTYEWCNNPAEKYTYIALLGHRVNKKIYSYSFTGHIQSGGYGTGPTREGAVASGLSEVFFYQGVDAVGENKYGFGKDMLKLKRYENPPSNYFWISKGVMDLFKIKRDTSYEIKTPIWQGSSDSNPAYYRIPVYTN